MKKQRLWILLICLTCLFSILCMSGCKKEAYTIEYNTNGGVVSVEYRKVEFGE